MPEMRQRRFSYPGLASNTNEITAVLVAFKKI